MIRRLVRRVILWAAPKLGLPSPGAYARGGEVRPLQENQDTVEVTLNEGVVEVSPEALKAYGHALNRLNRR